MVFQKYEFWFKKKKKKKKFWFSRKYKFWFSKTNKFWFSKNINSDFLNFFFQDLEECLVEEEELRHYVNSTLLFLDCAKVCK